MTMSFNPFILNLELNVPFISILSCVTCIPPVCCMSLLSHAWFVLYVLFVSCEHFYHTDFSILKEAAVSILHNESSLGCQGKNLRFTLS